MTSREEEIQRLIQFQDNELERLEKQIEELDKEIEAAELDTLEKAELVSAARALVQKRGGTVEKAKKVKKRHRVWANSKGEVMRHEQTPKLEPDVHIAPCGVIYTNFKKRFEAPRQSFTGPSSDGVIVITSGNSLAQVNVGCRLWLLYWLDRNTGEWRNFVRPPRAKGGWRVGVFASRSPNRPSPIGLSLCEVKKIEVEESRIFVTGLDVLDETPLLAMRVYNETDYKPDAKSGWLDDVERLKPLHYDDVAHYEGIGDMSVDFSDQAEGKVEFINERSSIDIRDMVLQSLKRIPLDTVSNPGKNVTDAQLIDGYLPVGAFRVVYQLRPEAYHVTVNDVISGMRRCVCEEEATTDPEAKLHLEFQDEYERTVEEECTRASES